MPSVFTTRTSMHIPDLVQHTYVFGISKVNGYTFLPRRIISEPIKKNKRKGAGGFKEDCKLDTFRSLESSCILNMSKRDDTNHLLCFYPGGLRVPNRNTSSCRCKPLWLCRLVHTSLPELFLWRWPKDTVLLFSCWSPPLPAQRGCPRERRYRVRLLFYNPQKNVEPSWWVTEVSSLCWRRQSSFALNPIGCQAAG